VLKQKSHISKFFSMPYDRLSEQQLSFLLLVLQ